MNTSDGKTQAHETYGLGNINGDVRNSFVDGHNFFYGICEFFGGQGHSHIAGLFSLVNDCEQDFYTFHLTWR